MAVPAMPSTAQYGYVVGRFLIAVGDTSADPDNYPDPIVPSGKVTMTPVAPVVLFPTSAPAVTILPKAIDLTLDADGDIVDPAGNQGVWLITGQYDVSFNFVGVSYETFRINVTTAHTQLNPLDLTIEAPIPTSPAVVLVVNQGIYDATIAARDQVLAALATVPDFNAYALKASPALTGVPTAPTAAAGTNTGQIATTSFVRNEITGLVGAAPGLLDTLDEVAQAIGDDPNFSVTIMTAIALKAPIASPSFTGVPLAPTPATSDNSTKIATTAWVKAQGYGTGTGTSSDATTTAKGIIQLAGDLGGTAASPTVPGLAAKAPLASPVLTGNPTAPTPAAGDNDTSIATTAFVRGELGDPTTDLAAYFTSVLPA